MAKVKGYGQQIDYTSKIQVGGRGGRNAAANNELAKANTYGVIGQELNNLVVERLKKENIKTANSLAAQLKYGTKTITSEYNGQEIQVDVPTVIAPETPLIRGESGLAAYKKLLAQGFKSELENDLLEITETEANRVESEFGTMEEFASITSAKHKVIYDNIPVEMAAEVRTNAEKLIIQRGARVQNLYLAEQHSRNTMRWELQENELINKIENAHKISDTETGNSLTDLLEETYEDGKKLNIRKAFSAKETALNKIDSIKNGYAFIRPLILETFVGADINSLKRDAANTSLIIQLLSKAPNITKGMVSPFVGKNKDTFVEINSKEFNEIFNDPDFQDKLGTELRQRLAHINSIILKHDDVAEQYNWSQKLINNHANGLTGETLTKEDISTLDPNKNPHLVSYYNRLNNRNLTVAAASNDMDYQIFVATDMQTLMPDLRSRFANAFKAFDVETIKKLYNEGFLSRLMNYKDVKGDETNFLNFHFPKLGNTMTRVTRMLDNGTATIEEMGDTYTIEKKLGKLDDDEVALRLGYNKASDLKLEFRTYYSNRFGGGHRDRSDLEYRRLIRKVATDQIERIGLDDFDVADYIYEVEENKAFKHALSKNTYVISGKLDTANPLYHEEYVPNYVAAEIYNLPSYNKETKSWDSTKAWGLSMYKDPLHMIFLNDRRGPEHWIDNSKYETVAKFVDSEFEPDGRIKLVPIGLAQKFPKYYVAKANDNGALDYVLDLKGGKAVFDMAQYYKAAYRNVVSGNDVFRQFVKDEGYLDAEGVPKTGEHIDRSTWSYWLSREWDQLYNSLDLLPDGELTTGEVVTSTLVGAANKPLLTGPGGIASLIPEKARKYGLGGVIKLLESPGKFSMPTKKGAIIGAITLASAWIFGTVYDREIDAVQRSLEGEGHFDFDTSAGSQSSGAYTAAGGEEFNTPRWLEDNYTMDGVAPYKFTEDFYNNTDDLIEKGTEVNSLLHVEKHSSLGWMAFPLIRIVNGKRVLLDVQEAMDLSIKNEDYIKDIQSEAHAIHVRDNLDLQIKYWMNHPNRNWWLKGLEK